ncbi:MAG: dTDP-6-deoxy-L-lyxo-4-hexulose reductase [Hyperionvirus sp.]|uniref:dTDP-6-deoxy-L-lyxo-4-hexulose reductase n=1 Tax=Hyperionvirus sp. TaxID=2487770 RepID=A0A3G5ADQ2_9VIRU|nr:MAG: dTDP-6-deoxy-L-lyxo-4-hexulose reductase [Hyperionvirus sp.]
MNKLPAHFDWKFYISYYADLRENGINNEKKAIAHYLNHGHRENRIFRNSQIIDGFDWEFYISHYGDLPKSGINNEKKAIAHYLNYGHRENRIFNNSQIIDDFDWEFYIGNYEDLRRSGIVNEAQAMKHYRTFGKNEGRKKHGIKKEKWEYPLIPKVGFTYWSGPMSYLHYLTLKSFYILNPDWKIILYRPKYPYLGENTWTTHEQSIKYTGKDYTEEALKLNILVIYIDLRDIGFRNDVPEVFKSNYLNYYVLATDGGVYFDMDILFIKPMNELDLSNKIIVGDSNNLDTVISYHENKESKYFSVGLLMGTPESIFYKMLFEEIPRSFNPTRYMSATNELYPRIFGDLQGIKKKLPDLKFANIGMNVIYPYIHDQMDILFEKNNISLIKNRTIGIHWYNGHPITKKFLNEANYDKDVTINTIIKKYLPNI